MKRLIALLAILIAMPLTASPSWEQQQPGGFSAAVTLSADQITTQDLLQATLTLTYPTEYQPNLNALASRLESKNRFTLLDESRDPERIEGDSITQKIRYSLQPWQPGSLPINIGEILLKPKGEGEAVSFYPKVFELRVELAEEMLQERGRGAGPLPLDGRKPIEISEENRQKFLKDRERREAEARRNQKVFWRRSPPWRTLLTLAGAVIAWMAARRWLLPFLKRKRAAATRQDPSSRALAALRELHEQVLPHREEFDAFYVALTDIVRRFIEEAYQLHAPEQTTEEFLTKLRERPVLPDRTQKPLEKFLTAADLVKFAKHQPSLEECQQAESAAQSFVSA